MITRRSLLALAALALSGGAACAQAVPPYFDRPVMLSATTGTGTITLGSAAPGAFVSLAAAGVPNGTKVHYVILDGSAWEIGTGTYTSSGTTLSRGAKKSSSGGSAISLDGGETIYLTTTADDRNFFAFTGASGVMSSFGGL